MIVAVGFMKPAQREEIAGCKSLSEDMNLNFTRELLC